MELSLRWPVRTSDNRRPGPRAGEVWSSLLWEVRCQMVARLGLSPETKRSAGGDGGISLIPPILHSSVAYSIITAAANLPIAPEAAADAADVREGFRIRCMGFSATIHSGMDPATSD